MAQTYPTIPSTDSLTASRQKLLDRDDAATSNFSGTAFPSTGLLVGMTCYRTDQNILYVLKDTTPTWIEVSDAAGASGLSPRATILETARTFAITGDASATGVTFNGSANVTLSLTLGNSGVTAGTYGKVTVDAKGRVTAGTTLVNADLPASGATAGTYTKVTINDRGVVTSGTTLSSADLPSSPLLAGTTTLVSGRVTNNGAVGLATDTHGFQIGLSTAGNIAFDTNDIQARNNGAASALAINPLGGTVAIGSAGVTTTINGDTAIGNIASFVQSGFDTITFAASITPALSGSNFKSITSTGAFTLNAPAAGFYSMVVRITNSTGAGAITLSGFSAVKGDPFVTTVGAVFQVHISRTGTSSLATVVRLS